MKKIHVLKNCLVLLFLCSSVAYSQLIVNPDGSVQIKSR